VEPKSQKMPQWHQELLLLNIISIIIIIILKREDYSDSVT